MRFLPVNLDALLVELDDLAQTLALAASLRAEPIDGVEAIVPAARTLLVTFRPAALSRADLIDRIAGRRLKARVEPAGERVEIPVVYDGADLAEVAALLDITPGEVVRRHTGSDYTVAFTGFAPGFAYLTGDHPSLDVPRRAVPRTRIPAGAVGLAGIFSGVYPQASPGGWQIIGVTSMPMWDLSRERPALLQPGQRVRFVDAGRGSAGAPAASVTAAVATSDPVPPSAQAVELSASAPVSAPVQLRPLAAGNIAVQAGGVDASPVLALASAPASMPTPAPASASTPVLAHAPAPASVGPSALLGAAADPSPGAAALTIRRPGLLTLFQDLGRPGQTGQGVSASGATDRASLRTANRLAGNPSGAACLEIVAHGGFELSCRGDATLAVTGADVPLTLVTTAGARWSLPSHRPFALADGDRLRLDAPRAGSRAYLAVRGGFDIAPVLGSCANDTLANLGPKPVAAGDVLAVRPVDRGGIVALDAPPPCGLPAPGDTVVLDVVMGPRTDWFTAGAVERLTGQPWTVTPQSDRVGLRLAGDVPLARAVAVAVELPSEGTVPGAIQVPPGGQPVLFLADHPLTGGYPVIAAVATHHLDRAGQIPVGARIRFHPIAAFEVVERPPP